jgi:hypothetical protein
MKTAIYTVPFSLNLSPQMFDEIKKLSDDAQISMAEQVRNLMEYGFRYIDQNEQGDEDE